MWASCEREMDAYIAQHGEKLGLSGTIDALEQHPVDHSPDLVDDDHDVEEDDDDDQHHLDDCEPVVAPSRCR